MKTATLDMGKALEQYDRFQSHHPECVLLFQIGDFYEAFGLSAEKLAKSYGLTLTSRSGRRMSGFPKAMLEKVLKVLVQAGHRVALGEQI